MLKIEMQLTIHRTDQPKFFPVSVLLQYARVSYASHCAILGCFAQIRTASVVQAAGHVLRKFRPSPGTISELVQRSGKALRHGLEPRLESLALRLGRIDWKRARCELRAALVLGESADTRRVANRKLSRNGVRGDESTSDRRRGDAEVRARQQESEQPADGRHGNVSKNECGPFRGAKHHMEDKR